MTKKIKSWNEFYNEEITLKDFLGNLYTCELFQEIIDNKPKRILEVGSGTGVMAILLSHLGYEVVSIDNNRKVLKLAKENNKKFNGKVKFEYGNAFKMKYKDNAFDLAYSQGFYEHFDNLKIKELVDEQLRVCKKTVVVSVPNNNYPEKDVGNERLMPLKFWILLLQKLSKKPVIGQDYQFMLRKNKPFRTIYNLITNKKVMSLVTIKK